jgi:hypothetical protein
VRDSAKGQGLKVKTHVRAGGIGTSPSRPVMNHNETLVRDQGKATGLKVKTRLRAGAINHNETLVRDIPRRR